jgi:MFS transporter, FHS family, Na+ dependent glucose transporter 1
MSKSATVGAPAVRPLVTTAAYYAAFVALGLVSASLGPTLPGLAENTGSLPREVSFLFTTRASGYLAGSMLGGRLYDRVRGHPVMASVVILMAICMLLTPGISLLWLLAVVLFVLGVGEGTLDVGGNTLLLWVQRHRLGAFMNGLHFFFGFGAFLAPIVVAQAVGWTGGIEWAYWALGLAIIPVGIWLAMLPSPVFGIQRERSTKSNVVTNRFLAALVALFMALYVGAEVSFGGWIYSYTLAVGIASPADAAYLNSAFWGAFTAARLLAIPLAARLRPRTILLGDLLISLASVGLILILPRTYWALWLGTIGAGAALASIFPTMIVWVERRMTLTGEITSWFFVGASLGAMTFPWLAGQLFDYYGPVSTMIAIFIELLVTLGLLGVVMVYGGPPKMDEVHDAVPGD